VTDIDYSKLSLSDLVDVATRIDRVAFPERAARVDSELDMRRRLPAQPPQERRKDHARVWFIAGIIVGLCGVLPFAIGAVLDTLGIVNIGNGLGLGLLLLFGGGLAGLLFLVGAIVQRLTQSTHRAR
jgi:hypothetical protein